MLSVEGSKVQTITLKALHVFHILRKILVGILHGERNGQFKLLIISYLRVALGGYPNSSEKEREK